jgi:hypothetical protein
MPIKIIRNTGFYQKDNRRTTFSEAEWLGSHPQFVAEELWPDHVIDAPSAVAMLGRSLHDPRLTLSSEPEMRGYGDQIQHFSCHCTRHDDGSETLGLRDQEMEVKALVIKLASLGATFLDAGKREATSNDIAGPLIFLNACGSGAINPKGRLSLVELLLNWTPARAIVATETPVDFPLAAHFARLVYEGLFAGLPLGRAMHRARPQMPSRPSD